MAEPDVEDVEVEPEEGGGPDAVRPPPNPAGPEGRPAWMNDGIPLSRPARGAVRVADRMPDWMGSIRFRLTALYSVVLFGLAAFMVAGLYGILSSRLHQQRVYVQREVDVPVASIPGGTVFSRQRILEEYRTVEQLANERALDLLRAYSLWALFILFLASLIVGWLVAGRVLAPIGRITSVARDIQATDLSRRIALTGPHDELRELADTFDAMLTRLDDAFDGQRRFIQETSHELRNPLAVIRTNLDVALSDPDPSIEDLRATAEVVQRNSSRMSNLVDDLLVYARSGAPAHELGPVDLADIVAEASEEFRAPAGARSLRIRSGSEAGLVVQGDRIALRRAVANLLSNAVRLAPAETTITVDAGRVDDKLWLRVADQGPGIAPEDRPHVFQRFWRGDQATAREQGHSGLGLAIVDQIARDHRGTVQLEPTPEGGSAFTIWLPANP